MVAIGAPLRGRDRLLALMDVGALLCRPRDPRCAECPLRRAVRDPRAARRRDPRTVSPRSRASFRQRRGRVMAGCATARRRSPTLDARGPRLAGRRRPRRRRPAAPPAYPTLRPAWSLQLRVDTDARARQTSGEEVARGGRGRESVRIDSGWNCTPSIGSSRWRRPITRPSSLSAVTSSTSGTESRSTISEW